MKTFKLRLHLHIALLYLIAMPVWAESSFTFAIDNTKLVEALNLWSKISMLTYLARPGDIRDINANHVHGEMSGEQALRTLLQGTGMTFRKLPNGNYIVEPKIEPDNTVNLQDVEELVVTGYKASYERSQAMKRQAVGVVDAVTQVEIARFPDSNLAESIQRIAGVSIDRQGNEGNMVTVRGLGPDFNLVTRNGRRTPVTGMSKNQSINLLAPASRSFEFINLASEGVEAVVVSKTYSAQKTSGGIGAVIDIQTPNPLDFEDAFFNFGVKGISESGKSHNHPGLYLSSGLKMGNSFAAYLGGSRQKRRDRFDQATISGWVDKSTAISQWFPHNIYEIYNQLAENRNKHPDGIHWAPLSETLSTSINSRIRDNLELSIHSKPFENLTLAFEHAVQKHSIDAQAESWGAQFFGLSRDRYFGQGLTSNVDQNGTTVALTKKDGVYHYEQSSKSALRQTKSNAFNLLYSVNPSFDIEFDLNHAKATSSFSTDELKALELGADSVLFTNTSAVPELTFEIGNPFKPAYLTTLTEPQPYTNFDRNLVNEITDLLLDFKIDMWEGLGTLHFGTAQLASDYISSAREIIFVTDWRLPFDFFPENNRPEEFFSIDNSNDVMSDFSGGLAQQQTLYVSDFNAQYTTRRLTEQDAIDCYCNRDLEWHKVSELTRAAYIQTEFNWLSTLNPQVSAGIRFENTSVTSTSLNTIPISIEWANPAYTYVRYDTDRNYESSDSDYNTVLPNIQARLTPKKHVIVRAAFSKSIARSDLTQMRNEVQLRSDLTAGRVARAGNPELKPFSSNNTDLSIEWYYANDSHLALTVFNKKLDNFVADTRYTTALFNLRDVYNGERANRARSELASEGVAVSDSNILQRVIENGGGSGETNSQGDVVVISDDSDPLILWSVRQAQNLESARIQGLEASIQHQFGNSGWGALFNYTLVESNKPYSTRELGYQFAIPGVSDTLNAVVYFEGDSFDVRAAYNWREHFLSDLNTFSGHQPQYTETYGQLDLSFAYQFTDSITAKLTVINATGENQRVHSRYPEQLIQAIQLDPVYSLDIAFSL